MITLAPFDQLIISSYSLGAVLNPTSQKKNELNLVPLNLLLQNLFF